MDLENHLLIAITIKSGFRQDSSVHLKGRGAEFDEEQKIDRLSKYFPTDCLQNNYTVEQTGNCIKSFTLTSPIRSKHTSHLDVIPEKDISHMWYFSQKCVT